MEERAKKSIKSKITLILRISVAAAACLLIFYNIDRTHLIEAFQRLHLWVIGFAVLVRYFSELVMATRWWLLLRALHIYIPHKTAVRLHFHGLFFSSFLPSSMGGDFIRAWYVTRHTHKRVQSALSVFVDRFTGLASTLSIAIVTYFLFLRPQIQQGQQVVTEESVGLFEKLSDYQYIVWIFLGLVCLVLSGILLYKPGRKWFILWILKLLGHGIQVFKHLFEVVSIFLKKLWLAPMVMGLTILFQCITFISFWLIGRDLGVSDEISHYFAIFPLVWVMGSIPISPAGIGILEGGVVVLFHIIAGADKADAAALALCQRALFLIVAIPGIWIHLRADYLPKSNNEFFVDDKQDSG